MHIFHHFDSIIWKVDTVLYTSNLDVIWISCWVDTVWLSSLFCQTSFWTTSPAHLARCGAVSTINGSNDLLSSLDQNYISYNVLSTSPVITCSGQCTCLLEALCRQSAPPPSNTVLPLKWSTVHLYCSGTKCHRSKFALTTNCHPALYY